MVADYQYQCCIFILWKSTDIGVEQRLRLLGAALYFKSQVCRKFH
jgi:hypothetical protein